ncbi:MAG: hypothetical protein QOI36_1728 [Pseudonocardiales bacterium]|nr:transporter [Pseudonocardia sp.]MDT7650322.1 hypothetical protein [Pseudonocardiales bacterium]
MFDQVPTDRVSRTLSAWSVADKAAIAVLTVLWGLLATLTSARTAIAIAGVLILTTPLLPRHDHAQQHERERRKTGAIASSGIGECIGMPPEVMRAPWKEFPVSLAAMSVPGAGAAPRDSDEAQQREGSGASLYESHPPQQRERDDCTDTESRNRFETREDDHRVLDTGGRSHALRSPDRRPVGTEGREHRETRRERNDRRQLRPHPARQERPPDASTTASRGGQAIDSSSASPR